MDRNIYGMNKKLESLKWELAGYKRSKVNLESGIIGVEKEIEEMEKMIKESE